jgi:hypothetical protein
MERGMPNEDEPGAAINPIIVMRRAFGPKMSASDILTYLVRDLVIVRALPIHIDLIAEWWLISSQKDWLLQPDGSESLENFRHIVRFPEAGREACHSEILLTAFAEIALTWRAGGEMIWITDNDRAQWKFSEDFLRRAHTGPGRVIVFQTRDRE